jgi:hypothetical protein
VEAFLDLKGRVDPDLLLQTDLWRRVFAPVYAAYAAGSRPEPEEAAAP